MWGIFFYFLDPIQFIPPQTYQPRLAPAQMKQFAPFNNSNYFKKSAGFPQSQNKKNENPNPNPNPFANQKPKDRAIEEDEIAYEIYQIVEKKYPRYLHIKYK